MIKSKQYSAGDIFFLCENGLYNASIDFISVEDSLHPIDVKFIDQPIDKNTTEILSPSLRFMFDYSINGISGKVFDLGKSIKI